MEQEREYHTLRRNDGSVVVYYTLDNDPAHYVVYDTLDASAPTLVTDRAHLRAEVAALKAQVEAMRGALEKIRDTAKSWEGRSRAPYWNLGDIAAATLKRCAVNEK